MVRVLEQHHIVVGKPEVVTDFVYQDMAYDRFEGFLRFTPVIENGSTVQKNGIQRGSGVEHAFMRQSDAMIKSEKVKGTFKVHRFFDFFLRKVFDPDKNVGGVLPQSVRNVGQRSPGEGVYVGKTGRKKIKCSHGINVTCFGIYFQWRSHGLRIEVMTAYQ